MTERGRRGHLLASLKRRLLANETLKLALKVTYLLYHTVPCHTAIPYHTIPYHTIEPLTWISLSARARLVHPWSLRAPTSKPPPFIHLPDLSWGSLFSFFLLALSVRSFFFLLSFRVHVCTPGTAPRASPASSRVSAGAGGYRGGLQGPRSPLWRLGVACALRHEGCMNKLCLASICDF